MTLTLLEQAPQSVVPLVTAVAGALAILIPAFLLHYREIKKLNLRHLTIMREKEDEIEVHRQDAQEHKIKANVLDSVLNFTSFNMIKSAVDEIFEGTSADRFLILIAVNGKTDFNIVSVIFEQHKTKNYKINAIARYRQLNIDHDYKAMLKDAERDGIVKLHTDTMHECLLKEIYKIEGVAHSDVRHIARVPVDEKNDVLIYSSLATHSTEKFSREDRTKAKIIHDSVIQNTLIEVLKKN